MMLFRKVVCIILVFSGPIARAQTWVETDRIATPFNLTNGITGVSFSNGKAISGNHYQELAVIYEQDASGNWGSVKITEVSPPDPNVSNEFGYSTAIYANTAVIGSPTDGYGPTGMIWPGFGTGAAFVFEKDGSGNWVQKQKLLTRDDYWRTDFTYFGVQVAIHDKTIAVGSDWTFNITPGSNKNDGAIYIFEQDAGGVWLRKQMIKAPDAANEDFFGSSIAIHGSIMVVGAYKEGEDINGGNTLSEAGSAYIYERDASGTWVYRQKITSFNREKDGHFGSQVSVYGNTVLVSANAEAPNGISGGGAAYVFIKDASGVWVPKQKLVASDLGYWEFFGTDVAVSDKLIAVGAHAEDHDEVGKNGINAAGAVYLFVKNASGDWVELKKLCASNRAANKAFGVTLAIDGTTVAVKDGGNVDLFLLNEADLTNQSVNFSALPEKKYGDPSFSLTASATSGLPVAFSSGDSKVATISGNTLTIQGVGSVTITARQPGNNTYDPSVPVAHTLTVGKNSQQITFAPIPEKVITDDDFYITANSNRFMTLIYTSDNPNVATIDSNGKISIHAGGTANITVSQNGDAYYEAALPVTRALVVRKLSQTVTFDELLPHTYGDEPFQLIASSAAGLPVEFVSDNTAVAQINGNIVTIVGSGTAYITTSQNGNASHDVALPVTRALVIHKLSQTVMFDELLPYTYGDEPFQLKASSSTGLPVNFVLDNTAVAQINGNIITIAGSGTAYITASQNGNANHDAARPVTRGLVVAKSPQSIMFELLPEVAEGAEPVTLLALSTSGLTVTFTSSDPSVATVNDKTLTILESGTCSIEARQDGNENYLAADLVSHTLTVGHVLGLETKMEENLLKLYPNPSAGTFKVLPPGGISQNMLVAVYNAMGNQVYYKIITTPTTADAPSVMLNAAPGLYTVYLRDLQSSKEYYGKLVIR